MYNLRVFESHTHDIFHFNFEVCDFYGKSSPKMREQRIDAYQRKDFLAFDAVHETKRVNLRAIFLDTALAPHHYVHHLENVPRRRFSIRAT